MKEKDETRKERDTEKGKKKEQEINTTKGREKVEGETHLFTMVCCLKRIHYSHIHFGIDPLLHCKESIMTLFWIFQLGSIYLVHIHIESLRRNILNLSVTYTFSVNELSQGC